MQYLFKFGKVRVDLLSTWHSGSEPRADLAWLALFDLRCFLLNIGA